MSVREYFGRDVRLRHLRLLVAIDDAGRLTQAARLLHITQPALSKALAEIERSIGLSLFDRTPQGLSATPAGAKFVRAARAALAEIERASIELQWPADAARRVLVVGAMPTTGWMLLADAVARFRMAHPAITVRVVDGTTGALLPQLVAGRVDLVVGARLRAAVPDGIEAIPLYDEVMQLVAAPRHPLVRARSVTWERIAAMPWVLPPVGNPIRLAFDHALRRNEWPAPEQVVEALASDTALALIESLQAVGLMPGRLAARLAARGWVRQVAPTLSRSLAIPVPLIVFAASRWHTDQIVLEMVRCLREQSSLTDPALT